MTHNNNWLVQRNLTVAALWTVKPGIACVWKFCNVHPTLVLLTLFLLFCSFFWGEIYWKKPVSLWLLWKEGKWKPTIFVIGTKFMEIDIILFGDKNLLRGIGCWSAYTQLFIMSGFKNVAANGWLLEVEAEKFVVGKFCNL